MGLWLQEKALFWWHSRGVYVVLSVHGFTNNLCASCTKTCHWVKRQLQETLQYLC